jgi:nucleotide-binding universal stress UspA family protein
MKTLLATDGSNYATTALIAASRLLRHVDNEFSVTCVIPEFTGKRFKEQYDEEMKRKTHRVMKAAARTLGAAGIEAHGFTETGSPADVLVRLAAGYDAVAAGAQSQSERSSPGLGPVASRIVEHVSGIVMVGRRLLNEKSFRVLVGVDGSASSANALDTLVESFRLRDAEVTVMHVVEKPWLRLDLVEEGHAEFELPYRTSERPEMDRLFGKELWTEAEQVIEDARTRLVRGGCSIESQIVEGNPANELLSQAEIGEYDLAVIGATGASDLKHTLLGSVSFKLASYAPCSVAVIR